MNSKKGKTSRGLEGRGNFLQYWPWFRAYIIKYSPYIHPQHTMSPRPWFRAYIIKYSPYIHPPAQNELKAMV